MTRAVGVTRRGLRFGDEDHLLFSAEVHYWRLDPANWGAVLDSVAGLGFKMIATYVPWSEHETVDLKFDFAGRLDVEKFVSFASDRGLKVILRPGPDCASELTTSGWSRRVLDDPRCQALRSDGSPYILVTPSSWVFAPSYASKVFLGEVARWYDAVCEVIAPLQYPDGPMVLCQVDNEMGFHFQGNSFALDYHPDAVEDFRSFVTDKTGQDQAKLDPPRGPEDDEDLRIRWVEWREHHLKKSIATLAGMMRERGIDRVPLSHNDYPRMTTPMDPTGLEKSGAVDVASGDVYAPKEGATYVREFARYLSGTSTLPYLAEMGAGFITVPWLLPMATDPADEEVIALTALFAGARAANVYMCVERDRWYGSPISETGEVRDHAALYPRLSRLLADIDFMNIERRPAVLLLENRSESRRVAGRDAGGHLVQSFPPLLPLDHRVFHSVDSHEELLKLWDEGLAQTLRESGVDYDRASTASLPDLGRYSIVVLPVLTTLDEEAKTKLLEAESKGTVVVAGPAATTLSHINDPSDVAELLPTPEFRTDAAEIDLFFFEGATPVLAAFNRSGEEREFPILFEGVVTLLGVWNRETLSGNGSLKASLSGHSAQVWRVRR